MSVTRPEEVSDDHERKGLRRAGAKKIEALTEGVKEEFNFCECRFHDCLADDAPDLNIETMGFDTIDLSSSDELQNILNEVRLAGRIEDNQSAAIRKLIKKNSYRLSNGKKLRLLYIAPEGFIIRNAGPNGLNPNPGAKTIGSNGHVGAMNVHGDQDVYGTPIKQILKGFGPKLFRHNTPDGQNTVSPIFLINLWIPLQQITRPLTLMDRRTLDKNDQLRFALPTDSFLERDEDQLNNDIWLFLHNKNQEWYFHSEMNPNKAYVFDTLGEPHGAFILPGEKRAEKLYKQLQACVRGIKEDDNLSLQSHIECDAEEIPEDTTIPLRLAISKMEMLLHNINSQIKEADIKKLMSKDEWVQQAEVAMDSVVRKSLEMRVVGVITPF